MVTRVSALSDENEINILDEKDGPQQSTSGPIPPLSATLRDIGKPVDTIRDRDSEVLLPVPGYIWRHGCGPTSLGMIIGYYDSLGYDDLVEGSPWTQTEAVNQMIASGGDFNSPNPSGSEAHFEDYAKPRDDHLVEPVDDDYISSGREPHADNSLADYMHTSKSTHDNLYSWSWSNHVGPAFVGYVNQQNPSYLPTYEEFLASDGTMSWDVLTNEIDAGRPMVFLVDSIDFEGVPDHFVAVVGYRTSPSLQYGMWDTYDDDVIRWEDFELISLGVPYGIWGGWRFNVNDSPEFTSAPVTGATRDVAYTYSITATDAGMIHGDELTITTVTKPGWLGFTDNGDGTAILTGTPTDADVGEHAVALQVTDLGGLFDTQDFTIKVTGVKSDFFLYIPLIVR